MLEKLLENWLDSASERSYQAVFVQMLSAQGFRVVHSTRHTALEFGKDILAIAPDGVGCAYQLKGNPGGRLGLGQFREEVQLQLVQLMTQPVVFPGFPEGPHRAYLVSNGFFDEEVQRAVDDLNRANYRSQVALISRGELLDWAKIHGANLWPSELSDVRLFLEVFLSDAKDALPHDKLATLLEHLLGLQLTAEALTDAALRRAVTSAALLTGIVTASFAEARNHMAVGSAWTLLALSVIAACEKHRRALTGPASATLALAEGALSDALIELWHEVKNKRHLVEGDAFADPEVYGWRYVMLLGQLSCLAFLHEAIPCLTESSYSELKSWLRVPAHDGHDSEPMADTIPTGMADSVPMAWRTLWRPDRNAVRHDFVTSSAIAGTRPVGALAPARGVSTQAFYTATLRPFCRRERDGGPEEACDAQDQRDTPVAPAGRRHELPADRPGGGLRQDGGGGVFTAGRGGGAEELGDAGRS